MQQFLASSSVSVWRENFWERVFEGGKAQIFSQIFAFAGKRIFPSRFGIGPKCSVIHVSASITSREGTASELMC